MLDHTFEGVPISQMATEDIKEILVDGFEVDVSTFDCSVQEAERMVRERLEIELLIRNLNLR